MKTVNKRPRKARASWFVPGFFIVLFVLVIIEGIKPIEKAEPPPPVFTEAQMHDFWDKHMNPVVIEQLGNGRHPIPAVNERYRELWGRIRSLYGTDRLSINASPVYNERSPSVVMGVNYDQGPPRLVIYVPQVMRQMMFIANDPSERTLFEGSIAIGMLHEMEHMARGGKKDPTKSELVEEEAAVWGETCEVTIPIFLTHGYPLNPSHQSYYDRWRTCGSANNACWQGFIGDTYAKLAKYHRP